MFAPLSTAAERAVRAAFARGPRLQPGDGQRAGRLHDAARVVEDVLDRRADLVVGHAHHFVHRLLREREGVLADLADGDAVGEDAHVVEVHATAGGQRAVHRVGLERLDADDLHLRHAAP